MGILWSSSTTFSGLPASFDESVWTTNADANKHNTVQLALSLVWSGQEIKKFNLDAINQFRRKFNSVPITHFISPAYFSRGEAQAQMAASKIKSVIKPGDRIGLQLGGWKSLISASNAVFRYGPTFWGSTVREVDCLADCGGDIPIHIYPAKEMSNFVRVGVDLLRAHGFDTPIAIQTEGFVSTHHIMAAAADAGISMDFSAIEPQLVQRALGEYPIYEWVRTLWTQVDAFSNPFAYPAGRSAITVVPNKLGAIDYHTSHEIKTIFQKYVAHMGEGRSDNHTFTMNIFQSTAQQQVPKLMESLQGIFAHCVQSGVRVTPLELPAKSGTIATKGPTGNKVFELPSH